MFHLLYVSTVTALRHWRASSAVIVLLATSSASLAFGQWNAKAPICPRTAMSSATLDGKVYCIGGAGCTGPSGTLLDVVEAYDPATDTWATKASLNTGRYHLASIAVAGKIYAIGGIEPLGPTYLKVVEEYDPVSDTWTTKAAMPTARATLALAAIGTDKIYAIGGEAGGPQLATVEVYTISTNTWAAATAMPTARWALSAATVDDNIYAMGGRGPFGATVTTVEQFNGTAWATVTSMPVGQDYFASVSDGCRIITVGRTGGVATVQSYDAAADTWTALPTTGFTSRFGLGLGLVKSDLIAVGGSVGINPTSPTGINQALCVAAIAARNDSPPIQNLDVLSAKCNPVSPSTFVLEVTRPGAPSISAATLTVRSTSIPLPNGVAAPPPIVGRVLCSGTLFSSINSVADSIAPIQANQRNWFLAIPPGLSCIHFCAQATTTGPGARLTNCLEGFVSY